MRAYAAAHVGYSETLGVRFSDLAATAFLQSEYTGGEDGRAYPVTIHGEIRGEADTIERAEPLLASAIGGVLPIIALAANAAVADPLAIATYGLPLDSPKPFIAYSTPAAHTWFPPGKRRIPREATAALMDAVDGLTHKGILLRAIESYRRALSHWTPEEALLAGEFLFIAAETLSRFLIEEEAAKKGITPKNLARLKGANDPDDLRRKLLEQDVFRGHQRDLEALRAASDGFEHGYMTVDDVRDLMEPVLAACFGHLRQALIAAAEVPAPQRRNLLAAEFDEPRGLVPVFKLIRGEMRRHDPAMATPTPEQVAQLDLEWKDDPPIAEVRDDGEVDVTLSYNVTVRTMPENLGLDIKERGIRAAHVTPKADGSSVSVTRAN
jgi:hypothetical protein